MPFMMDRFPLYRRPRLLPWNQEPGLTRRVRPRHSYAEMLKCWVARAAMFPELAATFSSINSRISGFSRSSAGHSDLQILIYKDNGLPLKG